MSRVCLITNGFTPNRVPLWNALNASCELTIIFLTPTEADRQWDVNIDSVHARTVVVSNKQVLVRRLNWALSLSSGAVTTALNSLRPDALIVGGYETFGYWAAQRWAHRNAVPVVLWMGSTLLSSRTSGFAVVDALKRRFIHRCDSYYTYGQCASRYVEYYGAPVDRIVTGTNHTNIEHFPSCTRVGSSNECALLYVGRLIPCKGTCELFEALSRLVDLPWSITIAGDGELRARLEDMAQSGGFADRVRWLNYVQQAQLSHVYRSADILIMPSHNEVWGLVVNEALLSGTYVIGSDRAAASQELLEPGLNGEIVTPSANVIEGALRSAIPRAPFDRGLIRATISTLSPEDEARKIMRAIELARTHVTARRNSNSPC